MKTVTDKKKHLEVVATHVAKLFSELMYVNTSDNFLLFNGELNRIYGNDCSVAYISEEVSTMLGMGLFTKPDSDGRLLEGVVLPTPFLDKEMRYFAISTKRLFLMLCKDFDQLVEVIKPEDISTYDESMTMEENVRNTVNKYARVRYPTFPEATDDIYDELSVLIDVKVKEHDEKFIAFLSILRSEGPGMSLFSLSLLLQEVVV